jgi:hypothetical protein
MSSAGDATAPDARHRSRVIRFWASLDLVVTTALAIPPLARSLFSALDPIDRALGGAGMPLDLPGFAWLFLHVTGTLGVLWASVRLARPVRSLGWADAIGRAWVGFLILRFVLAGGVPRALLLFVITEWGGAAAQLVALLRERSSGDPGP